MTLKKEKVRKYGPTAPNIKVNISKGWKTDSAIIFGQMAQPTKVNGRKTWSQE